MMNVSLSLFIASVFMFQEPLKEMVQTLPIENGQTVIIKSMKDPQWMPYKEAYKTIQWFNEYKGDKDLVETWFKLVPQNENVSLDDLKFSLESDNFQKVLMLDEFLRVHIPIDELAYRERAEFRINRVAGSFSFGNYLFIKTNSSNIYPVSELKRACQQALQIYKDTSWGHKKSENLKRQCTGIFFIFTNKTPDPIVFVEDIEGNRVRLPKDPKPTASGGTVVIYSFSDKISSDKVVLASGEVAIHSRTL